MLAGDTFEAERVEARCELTSSSGSEGKAVQSFTATWIDSRTIESPAIGIEISVEKNLATSVVTSVVEVPELGISYSGSGLAIIVRFTDVKVYRKANDAWVLSGSGCEVYEDGSLVDSAGTFSIENPRFAPDGIPFWGEDRGGGSAVTAFALPTITCDSPPTYTDSEYSSEATCAGIVGWRFRQGGTDFAQPIYIPVQEFASCAGSVTPPAIGDSDSWTIETEARSMKLLDITAGSFVPYNCVSGVGSGNYQLWDLLMQNDSASCRVEIAFDLAKSIERLNPSDCQAVWYRGRMSGVSVETHTTCVTGCGVDQVTDSSTVDVVICEAHPEFLETVGSAAGTIEAPFSERTPCLFIRQFTQESLTGQIIGVYNAPVCSPGDEPPFPVLDLPTYESFSGTQQTVITGSDSNITKMQGLTDAGRWTNQVCNPHWNFGLWFQDWDLDGSPTDAIDYWGPIRSQWIYESSLPTAQQRKTRNSVWLDVCYSGQLAPTFDTDPNNYLPWIGVCRHKIYDPNHRDHADYTSANSGQFSWTNATPTYGASITVTPSTTAPEVLIDLADWNTAPCLFAHLSDRIKITWSGANVTSVELIFVGNDGFEVSAGNITSGANNQFQQGGGTKYAGSWAIENGFGAISDLGADLLGSGDSSATMADSELAASFLLTRGWAVKSIKLKFTLSSTSAFTLSYPRVTFSAGPAASYWETGQCLSMVEKAGPLWRFGNQKYQDGSHAWVFPPTSEGLGYKPTAADAIAVIQGYFLASVPSSAGVVAELAAIWDSTEGTTIADYHTGTIGVPLPIIGSAPHGLFALINSCAEVPPINLHPRLDRSSTTYEETGSTYVQRAWSGIGEPRYYVGADRVDIKGVGGGIITVPELTGGWKVTKHNQAVNNSEPQTKVVIAGKEVADARIWHGYTAIYAEANEAAGNVSQDCHADGSRVRTFISGGTIWFGNATRLGGFVDFDTGITADWSSVRVDKRIGSPRISVIYSDAGAISEVVTTDQGNTFTMPTSLGSGFFPAHDVEIDGSSYAYWLSGGSAPYDVEGLIRDKAGNTLYSGTVLSALADEAGIAVRKRVTTKGKTEISLMIIESGTLNEYVSPDGRNFS